MVQLAGLRLWLSRHFHWLTAGGFSELDVRKLKLHRGFLVDGVEFAADVTKDVPNPSASGRDWFWQIGQFSTAPTTSGPNSDS
jgi:hypothetical protein